ncbi:HipA domain-containing protein [Niabella sp. CJ426]|uniref:HipA domain-containing protein n=1 Tax=Niabella sp. CJ426 TaxID=3393740 RepID=UPI003CFCAAEB
MMNCLGCYTEVRVGYCVKCRDRLFDKAKVPATLSFDAPKADNLRAFQEHSKRLSISGVQLKYSVRREENELVLSDTNGMYILKPVSASKQLLYADDAPENEHLTMQIARQVYGIQAAESGLIYFKDQQPAYITRRFDVQPDGNKLMQEDFAQLTNRTKDTHGIAYKYDGTYEEIGLLIKRYVAAAIPALERFFQLVIFNYVFSNGDAHLKNFSLMRMETGEYQLTPAYDLMCSVIHTPHEADTALDLYEGDMNSDHYLTHGYYGRADFMELANRLGIVSSRALRMIEQFETKGNLTKSLIEKSFLSAETKALYRANMLEKLKRLNA